MRYINLRFTLHYITCHCKPHISSGDVTRLSPQASHFWRAIDINGFFSIALCPPCTIYSIIISVSAVSLCIIYHISFMKSLRENIC